MRTTVSIIAWACAAWLLSTQSPAHASDFTPFAYLLLAVGAAVFAVVFAGIWLATRWIRRRSLRVLLRAMVIALFWTPVQFDGAGYWWPLCMTAGNIGDLPNKIVAVTSVIAATAALWIIGMALARVSSESSDVPPTEMKDLR